MNYQNICPSRLVSLPNTPELRYAKDMRILIMFILIAVIQKTHIKQEITEPEIKRIKDESGQSSPAKYPIKTAEYYETDSDDNESLDDEETFDTLPISH